MSVASVLPGSPRRRGRSGQEAPGPRRRAPAAPPRRTGPGPVLWPVLGALLLCAGGAVRRAPAQDATAPAPAPAPAAAVPEPGDSPDPAREPAVHAVALVLPAVVNINTERAVRRAARGPVEDFDDQFFDRLPGDPRSRELRQTIRSLGSGFLVDPDGLIVTNEHVVQRAADLKIKVTLADGATYPARYVTGDKGTDLALIKVERRAGQPPFPFVDLGRRSPNLLGQTVLVLGNPVGYNSSVSRGILSAKERRITVEQVAYRHLLQTDAAINPGNSGGPVIDLAGRLVGISSVKLAFTPQGTPTQGLGFAIPADVVVAKVGEFRLAVGAQLRPRLAAAPPPPSPGGGLDPGAEDDETLARLFGLTLGPTAADPAVAAVGVVRVETGSPADQAGLRAGMVLYRVGTSPVRSVRQVAALIRDVPAGTAVDLVVSLGPVAAAAAGPRPVPVGGRRTGGGPRETVTLIARR